LFFVYSHFQAILLARVLDILQPLLTNSIKEHECGAIDGVHIVPIVHIAHCTYYTLLAADG